MSDSNVIKASISKHFEKLTYYIENDLNTEEKLITEKLATHQDLQDINLNLTEYHVIAFIGDNEEANGTTLSKALGITKGGISKAATKLIKKGILYTEKLPNNKKEVYYKLTDVGIKVYNIHEKVHKLAANSFITLLDDFQADELATIAKFLELVNDDFSYKEKLYD